jgi:copper homeostasis protein
MREPSVELARRHVSFTIATITFTATAMIGALFEACVESVDEACEAAAQGADRVELCVDLAHDGCTPPLSLAAECAAAVSIPVIAIVRPRLGDFVYSSAEIAAMCEVMRDLAERGAAGFASGAIGADGGIDHVATARLVDAAGVLPLTFHRAFDRVPNAEVALETLIALGVRRVLTSGGAASAVAGLGALRRLADRAAGRIEIVAAGSVRPFNVERVIEATGVPVVHARWTGWRDALPAQ